MWDLLEHWALIGILGLLIWFAWRATFMTRSEPLRKGDDQHAFVWGLFIGIAILGLTLNLMGAWHPDISGY